MLKIILARIKQKYRTSTFPKKAPILPKRFRGVPIVSPLLDVGDTDFCPTKALCIAEGRAQIDLGRCLFCQECEKKGLVKFSRDYRMAVRKREDLLMDGKELPLAKALAHRMKKLFGRSLRLRHVSAGGCNGCEAECQVLNTLVFDLSRFGIQFVASPRHADGLIVTGPVTRNMETALKKTYEAVAQPKIVIAVGACAIAGGPFIDLPDVLNGANKILPVDLYIPGCPPHPFTILDGLLRLLDRKIIDKKTGAIADGVGTP